MTHSTLTFMSAAWPMLLAKIWPTEPITAENDFQSVSFVTLWSNDPSISKEWNESDPMNTMMTTHPQPLNIVMFSLLLFFHLSGSREQTVRRSSCHQCQLQLNEDKCDFFSWSRKIYTSKALIFTVLCEISGLKLTLKYDPLDKRNSLLSCMNLMHSFFFPQCDVQH